MSRDKDNIEVFLNGRKYVDFLSVSIDHSLESLVADFNMSTYFNVPESGFPFPSGTMVQIKCNSIPVFTGFVESINVSISDDSYTMDLSGRGICCDFIDSTVGAKGNIKTPIALKQIVRNLLDSLGMTYIKVIDRLNVDPFNSADAIQSNPTDTAYGVAERYAKKRQVFLMTDGNGDIIIDRPNDNPYTYIGRVREDGFTEVFPEGGTFIPKISIKADGYNRNSVKQATIALTEGNRFHTYRSRNQYNPMTGQNRKKDLQGTVPGVNYTVVDDEIRNTRVLDVIYDSVNLAEDTKKHLDWEKAFRNANSEVYTCVLPNWSPEETAEPWRINSLVDVEDELLGVSDTLLIGSVQFTLTENQIETSLTLKPADAYEVDIPKSKVKKKAKARKKKGKRTKKGIDPEILAIFDKVATEVALKNR
jgi:prophage tail gpP-like protein